ncbi:DUF3558 domain-containing protein [Streptomyces sp. NBC_00047]|uniref:DUF3558 family protein n=1 Tax=Streptomyces sp. NBC_00047 TaxID=2975627 RepID=UPI002250FAB5|nr:DUF3558 family protein [Streptomyces sp. NBC_00047]MCX5612801.1 DUF3558 domain-containing protein [Streptomyces sp. NBC_00047]
MQVASAAGLAIALTVVLSGCGSEGGSGAAGPDPDVPLKERTSIAQFDVPPLPVEKAKPCDLIRPKGEEELGLVPPDSMRAWAPRGGMAQTPTSCFWHNRVSEAVDLRVHRKPENDKDSAIRFALMDEHVDLIMGYPAGMLPISSYSCTVTVGVSDTRYLTFQVQSRNRAGPCALGVRAAQEAVRNMPAR